jgi:hypothetical protein
MNTQLYERAEVAPSATIADLQPAYDPNHLLDQLSENLQVSDDAELAQALELSRPIIGKIRLGKMRVGGTILLRMQELSGIPMQKLKAILGDKRSKFRFGQN